MQGLHLTGDLDGSERSAEPPSELPPPSALRRGAARSHARSMRLAARAD
jgi:hypothetical protein